MVAGLRERARFGPVEIEFDATVLRPRRWTLAQSEWAAEIADGRPMLELGCGAGQIGLAAAALSGCGVVQVDRDLAACRWAARNAAANGLGETVVQRPGTVDTAVDPAGRFTVVLADPPYVPSADVLRYPEDPRGAIDGGPDGLGPVRSFLLAAGRHLSPGGSIILQVRGAPQVDQTQAWLASGDAPPLVVAAARSFGPDRALARLTHSPVGRRRRPVPV